MPVDLSTTYLGLRLAHPVVAAPSPLSGTLEGVKRLAAAGASAIVLESLFEEQIDLEFQAVFQVLSGDSHSYADALGRHSTRPINRHRPGEYVRLIQRCRDAVQVPIIASLNGIGTNGWLDYALQFQSAGAHAIELNLYYLSPDPDGDPRQVERQYIEVVRHVARQVRIPIAVKVCPFFTSLASMGREFQRAGASGLVLFNRIYQPDVDLETRSLVCRMDLNRPSDFLMPLTWAAILSKRLPLDIALTGGVRGAQEVVKGILAGAKVAMLASRLLRDGPECLRTIVLEVTEWMRSQQLQSLAQIQGRLKQGDARESREAYMRTLHSFGTET